jgi:hypothetical protein
LPSRLSPYSVFFFWLVAFRFWSYARHISGMINPSAQRQREQPAYQQRHGGPPSWKLVTLRIVQAFFIFADLGLAWFRLRTLFRRRPVSRAPSL